MAPEETPSKIAAMKNDAAERIIQVQVQPRPYAVIIQPDGLATLGHRLAEQVSPTRSLVVTDDFVGPLHAEKAVASLRDAGFDATLQTVPAGEATKSLESAARLYDALAEARLDRHSPMVAVGGGVVGDLTGFVAATWLRGIPFVQCPTTLEADVDASVGGKTGLNHPSGKNRVGAFYQPLFVLIDTATLSSLSVRDFKAGLAESIKHAVIADAGFFEWHERHADQIMSLDLDALGEMVERNVAIKANVVARDEREVSGHRALLNFGHTAGHAIETAMARRHEPWRHGEAIAVGIVAAAEISVLAGKLDRGSADRIIALIDRVGLPTHAPLASSRDELLNLMQADKKAAAGRIRFVLADDIGHAQLYDHIDPDWIDMALDRILR